MPPLPSFTMPVRIPPKPTKAKNIDVTQAYLDTRAARPILMGYGRPQWIRFCEAALRSGLSVSLYEARRTVSKYVTLRRGGMTFKVRFSDHRPIASREHAGDCDFFVGVTNRTVTTTDDAWRAACTYLGVS